jgi:hypothetical protein
MTHLALLVTLRDPIYLLRYCRLAFVLLLPSGRDDCKRSGVKLRPSIDTVGRSLWRSGISCDEKDGPRTSGPSVLFLGSLSEFQQQT